MRVERVEILLLAGDAMLLGNVFSGDAHVVVVVDLPQPVVNHGIDDQRITHAEAAAPLGEEIGCVGHGFHATGDHDLRVAGLDSLHGQTHRLQPGTADLVDGHGAD